jgi:hypothetical protein
MKKLILILCIGLLLNACSSDSNSDNNSNNPSSTDVLLLKTITDDIGTIQYFNYNGNKLASSSFSSNNSVITYTYNGNLLIKSEIQNLDLIQNMVSTYYYSDNILTSYTSLDVNTNSLSTGAITYNSDGSVTVFNTSSASSEYNRMWKRFYSQNNCVKEEYYTNVNNVMTLSNTKTFTYDNKNYYFKSQSGSYGTGVYGLVPNNQIGSITKNAAGIVINVTNTVYQYNSQDYPINAVTTSTPYTPYPMGNSSYPGSSTITTESYTYY